LLVQQNVDRSAFFNRSWEEFKVGFCDTRGNYWLGNERLHQLTYNGRYKLRFDLQTHGNLSWSYAEYSSFAVFNETSNYKMTVSGYSGNAGDAFSHHDGMMFTTYDRDNDMWNYTRYNTTGNCAARNGGGFWYGACGSAMMNSVPGQGSDFRWYVSGRAEHTLLQSTRMWLIC